MAVEIAYGAASALSLDDVLAKLDNCHVRLDDPDNAALLVSVLSGLAANRDFLVDAAVAALKQTYNNDNVISRRYGPQVIMLGKPRSGWFLRANIWPAQQDYVVRASGKEAFFYGLPHDHNFDFLTIGYSGPGYVSDYYEQNYEAIAGYPGEPVDLHFVERSALSEGRMLHYRKHRDVHCQHAPAELSISLNLMVTAPEQYWFDQCQYDCERSLVSSILSQGANEALLQIAVAADHPEGIGLAHDVLQSHPSERMQQSAFHALYACSATVEEKAELIEACASSGSLALKGLVQRLQWRLGS